MWSEGGVVYLKVSRIVNVGLVKAYSARSNDMYVRSSLEAMTFVFDESDGGSERELFWLLKFFFLLLKEILVK